MRLLTSVEAEGRERTERVWKGGEEEEEEKKGRIFFKKKNEKKNWKKERIGNRLRFDFSLTTHFFFFFFFFEILASQ